MSVWCSDCGCEHVYGRPLRTSFSIISGGRRQTEYRCEMCYENMAIVFWEAEETPGPNPWSTGMIHDVGNS